MRGSRFLLLLALLGVPALVPACAGSVLEPVPPGIGNPRGGLGLAAPWEFGRTDRLAGRPFEAAVTALRVEQFARAADEEPLWQTGPDATLQPRLRLARTELRRVLGIAPGVPPAATTRALSAAAVALRDNAPRDAEAALSAPGFALGGAGTLARLSDMPRMPQVEAAAQAVAQAANPSAWNGR